MWHILFLTLSLYLFWFIFIIMQVCPSISLSLIIRVLCNFTPDEFCPDAVPGAVLEALNGEVCLLFFLSVTKAV